MWSEPLTNTIKSSAPAELQKEAETGRAHLMSLPRELRDKIYGYLLHVDGLAILRDERRPKKLDPTILRVNQTLHIEASRTLYVDNPWVYITIESHLLHTLCDWDVGGRQGFPGDRPISTGTSALITAEAVATMTLQALPPVNPTSNNLHLYLVVCLYAIPRLCRLLETHLNIKETDIAVHLNARNVGKVKEAGQERMMKWLEETRGFGRARVSGGCGNQSLDKLGALMMSPSPSLQEYLDRASAYRDRAVQKEKSGRLSEARYDYQDSYNLSLWSTESVDSDDESSLDDSDISVYRSILDLTNAVSVSYAFLLIKLRDLDRALYHIKWTLRSRLKNVWRDRYNVETAFVCGLRDLAHGADNGAAYCFLQILLEQPGHQGADDAVDEIESRLRYRTGWTELVILHNIRHVVQPFRRQKRGSAVMDKAAYEALVKQWLPCVEEVDSIGSRTRCCFHMGFDPDWVKRMYDHASAILYTR